MTLSRRCLIVPSSIAAGRGISGISAALAPARGSAATAIGSPLTLHLPRRRTRHDRGSWTSPRYYGAVGVVKPRRWRRDDTHECRLAGPCIPARIDTVHGGVLV